MKDFKHYKENYDLSTLETLLNKSRELLSLMRYNSDYKDKVQELEDDIK